MKTYTYSEARQRLAGILDEARRAGCVQIRRRDGQLFVLKPAVQERSPLDVPGVDAGLVAGEVVDWLRGAREESATRALGGATAGQGGAKTTTSRGRRALPVAAVKKRSGKPSSKGTVKPAPRGRKY